MSPKMGDDASLRCKVLRLMNELKDNFDAGVNRPSRLEVQYVVERTEVEPVCLRIRISLFSVDASFQAT